MCCDGCSRCSALGSLLAVILQGWFGYLQGHFWVNALAMGLSIMAISTFIIGCTALLGRAGIVVGAIITMLFANPLSGASIPYQFLVQPWGQIGQLMVPGAANWLIRTLSYFPDADTTQQWLVIVVWLVVGVGLALIGHYRSRAEMHVPPRTLDEGASLASA